MRVIGGSAITSATPAAFLLNLLFNDTPGRKKTPTEQEAAEPAVPDAALAT